MNTSKMLIKREALKTHRFKLKIAQLQLDFKISEINKQLNPKKR